ncbi:MAG: molybdopterin-dependent oxidoreductase [Alphaproteobacteria bacterium]
MAACSAGAETLRLPTGKPILTVTGKIAVTNDRGKAVFDRQMIEALGETSFSTATPWYDGPHKFEGVPLAKLLDTVGSSGDRLVVTALNDYVTEIPVADARKFGVILALKRDGQYMPVSDKGPIFIIYPFDSNSELKAQVYYKRSAWQVSRIEVK